MIRRGFTSNGHCKICHNTVDDVDQILRKCENAKEVWSELLSTREASRDRRMNYDDKFDNNYVLTLKNVRHVPALCNNLISCAALEEDGLEGRWGNGCMRIVKGSLVLFKAEKLNYLYVCHAKSVCDKICNLISAICGIKY
ncbi:hypothetical protein F511_13308 [Dorcoceras hygrometricum]|uniref:Uncharacterized protein n=1 Tax=Dorcoceras hygrometricum TaxID=472368 RepID=A0A2Z7BUJ1_9LAMI|nr:hypothetical protein F511_13308 [Dorcoceras hygrometricum]